jgi:HEAT repeat protein
MFMRNYRDQISAVMLSLCAALFACGCASTDEMYSWWPWYEPDQTAELERYGPISRQKIEYLREMQDAPSDDTVAKIAQQIQQERDPSVRLEMVRTLAQHSSPQARSLVAAALKDSDPDVRVTACEELGRVGGEESARLLAEALASDTNVDVRIAATEALGEMRDPRAVPLIAVALEDQDPALQLRGMEAMRLASGKNLGNDVNKWRQYAKNPDTELREESIADRFGKLLR